jgi:hypothetical protein
METGIVVHAIPIMHVPWPVTQAHEDEGFLDISERIKQLSSLRAQWPEPPAGDISRRRAYAAWCNAGIEGNGLPWPRALAMIETGVEPDTAPQLEISGCLRALEFIDGLAGGPAGEEGVPDLALIREIHSLLMSGLGPHGGVFRQREVKIIKQSGPGAGEPVFTPPHSVRVPELLDSLIDGVKRELAAGEDVFLVAGRFHYEFQSIHPFADGNGRVGRILTTLLTRRGWLAGSFYLSPAIARAGSRYYLALRAVRADYESEVKGGLLPWLLPFLDFVEDALTGPDLPEENRC